MSDKLFYIERDGYYYYCTEGNTVIIRGTTYFETSDEMIENVGNRENSYFDLGKEVYSNKDIDVDKIEQATEKFNNTSEYLYIYFNNTVFFTGKNTNLICVSYHSIPVGKVSYGDEIFDRYIITENPIKDKNSLWLIAKEDLKDAYYYCYVSDLHEALVNAKLEGHINENKLITKICKNAREYEWEVLFKLKNISVKNEVLLFESQDKNFFLVDIGEDKFGEIKN